LSTLSWRLAGWDFSPTKTNRHENRPAAGRKADFQRMTALGVRRAKAALSSGWKSHPAIAPAGSNRSSHGGNEVTEAFD
jgi:hypothetical protein